MWRRALQVSVWLAAGLVATSGAQETGGPPEQTRGEQSLGGEGVDPQVARLITESVEAVRADPSSVEAWRALCTSFEANLFWSEAAECYQELARLEGEVGLWPYHKAVALLELGEPDAARRQLEEAVARDPELLPALERLGHLLLEQGELDAARSRFERLVELAPTRAAGHLGLGEVDLQRGEPGEAVGVLETAAELEPGSTVAHYQLGLAYRALGRAEEAERELALGLGGERIWIPSPLAGEIASRSLHVSALLEQAAVLLSDGANEEAASLLEGLVERSPENVTLLNDLAIAYMRLERLEEARVLLDQALTLDERSFSTHLNLSAWAAYSNRPEDAVEYARTAVELAPSVADTHLALARSLGDRRYLEGSEQPLADRAEMLAEMRKAIEIGVEAPDAYLQLARELWRENRTESALASLEAALARWPDFWPADLMTAWIHVRGERYPEAAEALERVRAIVPDHPDVATLEEMISAHDGEG